MRQYRFNNLKQLTQQLTYKISTIIPKETIISLQENISLTTNYSDKKLLVTIKIRIQILYLNNCIKFVN